MSLQEVRLSQLIVGTSDPRGPWQNDGVIMVRVGGDEWRQTKDLEHYDDWNWHTQQLKNAGWVVARAWTSPVTGQRPEYQYTNNVLFVKGAE